MKYLLTEFLFPISSLVDEICLDGKSVVTADGRCALSVVLVDNVPSLVVSVTAPLVDDVSSDGCSGVTALLADGVSSSFSVVEASFGEVVGTDMLSLVSVMLSNSSSVLCPSSFPGGVAADFTALCVVACLVISSTPSLVVTLFCTVITVSITVGRSVAAVSSTAVVTMGSTFVPLGVVVDTPTSPAMLSGACV